MEDRRNEQGWEFNLHGTMVKMRTKPIENVYVKIIITPSTMIQNKDVIFMIDLFPKWFEEFTEKTPL